jgi:hypothetical protein
VDLTRRELRDLALHGISRCTASREQQKSRMMPKGARPLLLAAGHLGIEAGLAISAVGRESGLRGGDAPVLEAQVGAGSLQPFVQSPVVGGELPDTLFERGVAPRLCMVSLAQLGQGQLK